MTEEERVYLTWVKLTEHQPDAPCLAYLGKGDNVGEILVWVPDSDIQDYVYNEATHWMPLPEPPNE